MNLIPLGGDQLPVEVDVCGETQFSLTDYALAGLDELKWPRRPHARFTVGY